jgi:aspartyl-tRNA(Asn)/glutamyl-tRNA(Gln) amidotransferase subunit C
MELTRADVEKVSLLARLLLSDDEIGRMSTQLTHVVGYVEQLQAIATDGVEPMVHAVDMHNVFASDVLEPSLPRELALANAPKHDAECFRVPAVLGE